MPITGLPVVLEKILESVLELHQLQNWNIFNEKNGNVSVKLRFSKEGQGQVHVQEDTISYRRKSSSQIKRDQQRAVKRRRNSSFDMCVSPETDRKSYETPISQGTQTFDRNYDLDIIEKCEEVSPLVYHSLPVPSHINELDDFELPISRPMMTNISDVNSDEGASCLDIVDNVCGTGNVVNCATNSHLQSEIKEVKVDPKLFEAIFENLNAYNMSSKSA